MSAVVQACTASGAALPLLADADPQRIVAWRGGVPVPAAQFLRDVQGIAARLPATRHIANLCAQRYDFMALFCAVAVSGRSNVLPASRAPEAIAAAARVWPDVACIGDADLEPAAQRLAACAPAESCALPAIPAAHVVAIGFTSGSTGQPQAHRKTWAGVCASSLCNARTLHALADVQVVATVPPQHMYGLELSVLLPLRSRAAIHCGTAFLPADVAHALAQVAAPRMLVSTPHHLRTMLDSGVPMPPIERIVSATAPLDAALARSIERRFGTAVLELFGSTESCVIAHRSPAHETAWRLYEGISLQPQPDGTRASGGHLSEPVLLQDIVEPLDATRFELRGRNGDLLEIAGKRASLAHLNHCLRSLPGVHDGVVFVLPADARGVSRLGALFVSSVLDPGAVKQALRQSFDAAFVPREVRRMDALPRNALGKLPRASLLSALRAVDDGARD